METSMMTPHVSSPRGFCCTTIIVGKKATVDGSVIVAHSDDDVADQRVVFVPTLDQSQGRNVYYDNCSIGSNSAYNSTDIRRYIGTDRGLAYDTRDYAKSIPIGSIKGVAKTYAYFDCNYGIMNEHGLMFGECTCGCRQEDKVLPSPQRLFYASELSRVALERCKTAVEAIECMGDLIRTYGIYGTGETLTVGDANEAWVFEMCPTSKKGNGAGVWVAQRVPDDGFFVAANEFRIRDVYRSPKDPGTGSDDLCFKSADPAGNTILYSANLFPTCDPSAKHIDWLPTVSYGEYSHPYYSLRRVWRALSLAKPSLKLKPGVKDGYTRAYPFSVKPDKKLSVADIAAIYRDSYEGSAYDQTTGIGAGPFGTPVRVDVNPDHGEDTWNLSKYHPKGAWERPISIYRCGNLWINQAKTTTPRAPDQNFLGYSWIAMDRPATNCLMPFDCRAPSLPVSMETMNILDFQFGGKSAWWAFNFVANYLNLNYCNMLKDLQAVREPLEQAAFDKVAAAMKALEEGSFTNLQVYCAENCEKVVAAWWHLATHLIVKYCNGCVTLGPNSIMAPIGYPTWWLKTAGYFDGPVKY
jgi:dipeptidase